MAIANPNHTAAAALDDAPQSWRDVRRRLREDRQRLREVLDRNGMHGSIARLIFPAYTCVWLFRWAHYFARNRHRRLARACWLINVYLTGADITPRAQIGGGLYIPHPAGVAIHCRAGRCLTVMAAAGIGPGAPDGPTDAVPDIGHNVCVSYHSGIYGPVRIGDNVYIAPGCIVDYNVADSVALVGAPPDIRQSTKRHS
jgi:serine O-acetyltransferase